MFEQPIRRFDRSATFEAPAAKPTGYTFIVFLVSEAVFILTLDIKVTRKKKKKKKKLRSHALQNSASSVRGSNRTDSGFKSHQEDEEEIEEIANTSAAK